MTLPTQYTDWRSLRLVPAWLQQKWGLAYNRILGSMADLQFTGAQQAIFVRYLKTMPVDALPFAGQDSDMDRYPADTDGSYRARLLKRWSTWPQAGQLSGIIGQLKAFGFDDVRLYPARGGQSTGGPPITLTGTPAGAFSLVVEILSGGILTVSTFRYSLNDGATFAGPFATAATYAMTNGVELNFSAGTYLLGATYWGGPNGISPWPPQPLGAAPSWWASTFPSTPWPPTGGPQSAQWWSRFWIVLSEPFPAFLGWQPRYWGDGSRWGGVGADGTPYTWGSTATVQQVQSIRALIRKWKAVDEVCAGIWLNFSSSGIIVRWPGV